VVPVYQSGTIEGHLYYTMPFLRGGSLRDRLDVGRVPLREGVQVLADVARSVHLLHTQEPPAVHRDLKPANLLFGGPELADPWIADLGLAKLLVETADATLTAKDGFLGTPGYMAPEQVFGGARRVGPAADVHALGAILYELLTGRPPFREETPQAAALRTLHEDPLPPRRLVLRGVPAELEVIALKALAKDPADRYASAAALADDLSRWLDDRPILARPPTVWDRVRSIVRRNPLSSALGALAVVFLVAGAATSTALYLRERAEKDRADRNALRVVAELGHQVERLNEESGLALAGLTVFRENLLRDTAEALESIVRENAGIGSIELGTALNRRVLVRNLLGENAGALEDSRRAEAVFAALPPSPEARSGLAEALLQSGRLLAALGRPAEGRPLTERAIALLRDLVSERPDDTATRFRLARAELNLGNFDSLEGQPRRAIAQYRKALDHLASLRKHAGDRPQYIEWEARTRSNLGLILADPPKAVETQTEANELAERLVAAQPGAIRALDCLGACRINLGEALLGAGRLAEAEAAFQRALEPYQTLATRFPDETEPVWSVALIRTDLAEVLGRLGRWAEAVPLLEEAGATYDRLLVRLPDNPDLGQNLKKQRELLSEARKHLASKG
jgi:tetratricopeptide (TPR) repeat protein